MTESTTLRPAETASSTAAPTPVLSVLSLVFSLVAIPTGWFPLAVAGVVLGFLGRSREPNGRGLALWGLIVGFVALFWWVAALALGAVGVLAALPFWIGGAILG